MVTVKLKNGETRTGNLWLWRPKEGFFTLAVEDGVEPVVWLRDVVSAVNYGTRTSVYETDVDEDLLERARRGGWDGT